VSVNNEGLVLDWWSPLRIYWGMLPGGQTDLNFYRDGDQFIARYDFSFDQGDINLDGILGQLVAECWIENWDVSGINDMVPIQLPSRIDKRPVSLTVSDFTVGFSNETIGDVYVNQTAEFDVTFNGSMNYFDSSRMTVGYESYGIRTPIDCFPNFESGVLHCSFIPLCTDMNYDDYPAVCGTGLNLYAEYSGDPYNEAASAPAKTFNVKRGEVRFYPYEEGSLSRLDLYEVEAASGDLTEMGYGAVRVGGWTVDSFLPREIRSMDGPEFKSYPVIFRYEKNTADELDENRLRLEVNYQIGTGSLPVDDSIMLKPRILMDDMVYFELDFGSFEILDDGRTVRDALADAVTITGLKVRYLGSPLIGPSSASYEAEDLTFALKVVTLVDFDMDISMPGMLRFNGSAVSEMQVQPFTVYCSQLYELMQCSAELPLDILNEKGEPILSEIVGDGCWGTIQTKVGVPVVYVNNSVYPQCYLTSWNNSRQIMIAMDVK
jgi:hypothetical protein